MVLEVLAAAGLVKVLIQTLLLLTALQIPEAVEAVEAVKPALIPEAVD
jgi:hypothetical protein